MSTGQSLDITWEPGIRFGRFVFGGRAALVAHLLGDPFPSAIAEYPCASECLIGEERFRASDDVAVIVQDGRIESVLITGTFVYNGVELIGLSPEGVSAAFDCDDLVFESQVYGDFVYREFRIDSLGIVGMIDDEGEVGVIDVSAVGGG